MGFFDQGGQAYDPNAKTSGSFTAIEAGLYDVDINSVSIENTKDGTGKYVKVRYDIVGPSYQGRVLYSNFNIENKSPEAEAIGRGQLNELQGAAGVLRITSPADLQQFVAKRIRVKVAKKVDKENGDINGFKNEVKGWQSLSGGSMPQASMQQPQQVPQAQVQKPKAGGAPW